MRLGKSKSRTTKSSGGISPRGELPMDSMLFDVCCLEFTPMALWTSQHFPKPKLTSNKNLWKSQLSISVHRFFIVFSVHRLAALLKAKELSEALASLEIPKQKQVGLKITRHQGCYLRHPQNHLKLGFGCLETRVWHNEHLCFSIAFWCQGTEDIESFRSALLGEESGDDELLRAKQASGCWSPARLKKNHGIWWDGLKSGRWRSHETYEELTGEFMAFRTFEALGLSWRCCHAKRESRPGSKVYAACRRIGIEFNKILQWMSLKWRKPVFLSKLLVWKQDLFFWSLSTFSTSDARSRPWQATEERRDGRAEEKIAMSATFCNTLGANSYLWDRES